MNKNMFFGAKKELILLARELRNNMTLAETVLWSFLRRQQVEGIVFRRQHPIDIFIVDFYCHKYKLVIEVDGGIHANPDIAERDEGRTVELQSLGLKVIRFSNEDVIHDTQSVINIIKAYLI